MSAKDKHTESTETPPEGNDSLALPPLPVEEPDQATAERDRLNDLVLRTKAEFDNFRKRTAKEKMETWRAASMDVVRSILPVLDGLELALQSPAGNEAEMRRGVEMLLKQFREILEKTGVKPVPAVGAKFDPHLHHAVEMVETVEHKDHTVIEEYQRGYFFQDQLLRPAMVRVAVCPRTSE